MQTMQGALAAEYEEEEKPIKEIIEEEGSDYKSKLMEDPEEAVTKKTVGEEILPEEEPEKKKKPSTKKVERPVGFFKGARIELKSRTAYFDRTNPGGIEQAVLSCFVLVNGKISLQSILKYLPHRNYMVILIGTERNSCVTNRKK
jgi:hypothetical protein